MYKFHTVWALTTTVNLNRKKRKRTEAPVRPYLQSYTTTTRSNHILAQFVSQEQVPVAIWQYVLRLEELHSIGYLKCIYARDRIKNAHFLFLDRHLSIITN